MADYQVTRWRDIPSMVVARVDDEVVKIALAARFQEAIDEAAMRLGETDADAYLAGWARSEWQQREGSPADVAALVAAELDAAFPQTALDALLDDMNGAQG